MADVQTKQGSVMSTVSFRNRDGKLVDVPSVTASRLKTSSAPSSTRPRSAGGGDHQAQHARAVLLSYAEFEALAATAAPALDELSERFDELLATMQRSKAKAGVAAAFDATPEELGAAAVKAARTAPSR